MAKVSIAKEFDKALKARQEEILPGFVHRKVLPRSPEKNQFHRTISGHPHLFELQWNDRQPGSFTINVMSFVGEGDDLSTVGTFGVRSDFEKRTKAFYRIGHLTGNHDKWWHLKDPEADIKTLGQLCPEIAAMQAFPPIFRNPGHWFPATFDQPLNQIIDQALTSLADDVGRFLALAQSI